MSRSHYTFGDNSLAARRLTLLADTFERSSRAFLERIPLAPIQIALDVGCGPGHTTRLLADVCRANHVVGFDQSPAFVELANAHYATDERLAFRCCNVLDATLALPKAQLAFCRFLLTHLAEPVRAMENVLERLEPGGHLVVEEIERLEGQTPLLRRYYELVSALQANHGQSTTIGTQLEGHVKRLNAAVTITSSECQRLVLTGTEMPELHLMNIATWRRDPKIGTVATNEELDAIERGLAELVASGRAHVECSLRQVVLLKSRADGC